MKTNCVSTATSYGIYWQSTRSNVAVVDGAYSKDQKFMGNLLAIYQKSRKFLNQDKSKILIKTRRRQVHCRS